MGTHFSHEIEGGFFKMNNKYKHKCLHNNNICTYLVMIQESGGGEKEETY